LLQQKEEKQPESVAPSFFGGASGSAKEIEMEVVANNKIEVSCDICGEGMKKQGDTWACYPCKHMLYESEVCDHQVTIIEEN
jgi:hypothetical protein